MKKLYTFILITAFAITGYSQQTVTHIKVEKNDNSENVMAFEELQRITFNGTTVNIEQKGNNGTAAFDMADIARITSYHSSTGISENPTGNQDFVQYVSRDEIAVNVPAGAVINLYSISGSHILTMRQVTDNGTISIASLPKGIYLIKANERTAKIIKR